VEVLPLVGGPTAEYGGFPIDGLNLMVYFLPGSHWVLLMGNGNVSYRPREYWWAWYTIFIRMVNNYAGLYQGFLP